MAAIARDDEAEIRECCECLLLALMSKQVLLQATISKCNTLVSSCSKLRRDEGPVEVQSLPERLVLLCKVPKGEEAFFYMYFSPFQLQLAVNIGD